MNDEALRRYFVLSSFFDRVETLAVEFDAKTITAERFAERARDLAKHYSAELKKKDETK